MNTGIISNRYAKALLLFAEDAQTEDRVYNEMLCLSKVYFDNPELKEYFENPVATAADKEKLLLLASGGEDKISSTTAQFIRFVVKKGKERLMQFIALTYQDLYREDKKIVSAQIVSAKKMSETNLQKIVQIIEQKYKLEDNTIQLDVKTNPDLIGGFVLRVGNNKLDASVLGELNEVKRKIA